MAPANQPPLPAVYDRPVTQPIQLPPSDPTQMRANHTFSFVAVHPDAPAPKRRASASRSKRGRTTAQPQASGSRSLSAETTGLGSAGPSRSVTAPKSFHPYQRPQTPPAYVPPPEARPHHPSSLHDATAAQRPASPGRHASRGEGDGNGTSSGGATNIHADIVSLLGNLPAEGDRHAILSALFPHLYPPRAEATSSGPTTPQNGGMGNPTRDRDVPPYVMVMDQVQHMGEVVTQHVRQTERFQYVDLCCLLRHLIDSRIQVERARRLEAGPKGRSGPESVWSAIDVYTCPEGETSH